MAHRAHNWLPHHRSASTLLLDAWHDNAGFCCRAKREQRELATTDTELKLIVAAVTIGLSRTPIGDRAPLWPAGREMKMTPILSHKHDNGPSAFRSKTLLQEAHRQESLNFYERPILPPLLDLVPT